MIGPAVDSTLIAVTGIGVGVVTFFPNAMMCDSGTTVAVTAANTGIAASLSWIIGGIVGAIYRIWWALLPGLILQISAFTIPSLPYFQTLHEQQLKEKSAPHTSQDNFNTDTK